jgi:hypothetical protein
MKIYKHLFSILTSFLISLTSANTAFALDLQELLNILKVPSSNGYNYEIYDLYTGHPELFKSEVQTHIDGRFIEIFKTSIGQNIIGSILSCNTNRIQAAFGLTKEAAELISSNCNPNMASNRANIKINPSHLTKERATFCCTHRTQRFVFTPNKNYAFSSWTKKGFTFIPIYDPSLPPNNNLSRIENRPKILNHQISIDKIKQFVTGNSNQEAFKSFIHEIAIYFDDKNLLLNDESTIFIKHAFSAIRALIVENEILKELGMSYDSRFLLSRIQSESSEECSQNFVAVARSLLAIDPRWESRLGRAQKAVQPYCNELSIPTLGDKSIEKNEGPRPRMNSGGD